MLTHNISPCWHGTPKWKRHSFKKPRDYKKWSDGWSYGVNRIPTTRYFCPKWGDGAWKGSWFEVVGLASKWSRASKGAGSGENPGIFMESARVELDLRASGTWGEVKGGISGWEVLWMKAQNWHHSCESKRSEQRGGWSIWETFSAWRPLRHLFAHWAVWLLSWEVHGNKTTQMKVDISFPEVSSWEGSWADSIFNQPVRSLLNSDPWHVYPRPQDLAAWAQKLKGILLLIHRRVLQRYEDKLPHPQGLLQSRASLRAIQFASQFNKHQSVTHGLKPVQTTTGSVQLNNLDLDFAVDLSV